MFSIVFLQFTCLIFLKNFFIIRGASAQTCPLWVKILGVTLLVTLVAGGAIFTGVYFGINGEYFYFFVQPIRSFFY
jgi:hypothetical protein